MAKFFVIGGAGFIGSNFVDSALGFGHDVTVFDSLETGLSFFLKKAETNARYKFIQGDIRELDLLIQSMKQVQPDWVIHLAANADVRFGLERPRRDLDYNTIGTWNVTEAARQTGIQNILFSSTGSVYGEPEVFPTPEDCPFPVQTSLYAASKAAGEGILAAYANGYKMNCIVFRFVSILGPRYTHGHIIDFLKNLKKDPTRLEVLGDGSQLKSYLHVQDLLRGLWCVIESHPKGFQIFNIGHDDALMIKQNIEVITQQLNIKPEIHYKGGARGWIGDSPRIQLDCSRLKKLGWKYQLSIQDGIRDSVKYLLENEFLLTRGQS